MFVFLRDHLHSLHSDQDSQSPCLFRIAKRMTWTCRPRGRTGLSDLSRECSLLELQILDSFRFHIWPFSGGLPLSIGLLVKLAEGSKDLWLRPKYPQASQLLQLVTEATGVPSDRTSRPKRPVTDEEPGPPTGSPRLQSCRTTGVGGCHVRVQKPNLRRYDWRCRDQQHALLLPPSRHQLEERGSLEPTNALCLLRRAAVQPNYFIANSSFLFRVPVSTFTD